MPIDNASRQAIAARLKDLRLRLGYTDQRSFAQLIGVTGGLVGQWETGAKGCLAAPTSSGSPR